eukprot:jgi/Mesvir1/24896/Mv22118-RA.2
MGAGVSLSQSQGKPASDQKKITRLATFAKHRELGGVIPSGDIVYLDISSRSLSSVPRKLWEKHSLVELSLARNSLRAIPAEISSLRNLEQLDLSFNQLTAVPGALFRLPVLKDLRLSDNLLEELPLPPSCPDAPPWSPLRVLRVDNNRLRALPAALGTLSSLQEICTQGNTLEALPSSLWWLPKLSRLLVSQNRLSHGTLGVEAFVIYGAPPSTASAVVADKADKDTDPGSTCTKATHKQGPGESHGANGISDAAALCLASNAGVGTRERMPPVSAHADRQAVGASGTMMSSAMTSPSAASTEHAPQSTTNEACPQSSGRETSQQNGTRPGGDSASHNSNVPSLQVPRESPSLVPAAPSLAVGDGGATDRGALRDAAMEAREDSNANATSAQTGQGRPMSAGSHPLQPAAGMLVSPALQQPGAGALPSQQPQLGGGEVANGDRPASGAVSIKSGGKSLASGQSFARVSSLKSRRVSDPRPGQRSLGLEHGGGLLEHGGGGHPALSSSLPKARGATPAALLELDLSGNPLGSIPPGLVALISLLRDHPAGSACPMPALSSGGENGAISSFWPAPDQGGAAAPVPLLVVSRGRVPDAVSQAAALMPTNQNGAPAASMVPDGTPGGAAAGLPGRQPAGQVAADNGGPKLDTGGPAVLNLAGCGLSQIPPGLLSACACVAMLDLSQNGLMVLPAEIGCLQALQELNLSCNMLKQLPPELGRCTSLQVHGLLERCAYGVFTSPWMYLVY